MSIKKNESVIYAIIPLVYRLQLSLLLLVFILTGCNPPVRRQPVVPPWIVRELTDKSIDVPYEAVSVRETARYTPPDSFIWPESFGIRGQTLISGNEDEYHLYTASLAKAEVPARAHDWNLSDNSVSHVILDPQPPENTWRPIPIQLYRETPGTETIPGFVYVSPNGESSIRAVSIDNSDPIPLPIIDRIFIINPWLDVDESDSNLNFLIYDVTQMELSATELLAASNGDYQGIVFEKYIDWEVRIPDKPIRLVPGWVCIRFNFDRQIWVTGLYEQVMKTFGAEFTGWYDNLFFFQGESPFDSNQYTYITDETNDGSTVLAIPPWSPSSDIETPETLKITGYIPAVRWNSENVFFAEYGAGDNQSAYYVAISMAIEDLEQSEPSVIWHAEVPNMFSISTVIYSGTIESDEQRPYIVCLNPLTGELTVFDPLLGSIRNQTIIELSDFQEGGSLASFCANFERDTVQPVVFIHDPNANEIIQLELEFSEPGTGINIRPLDD